MVGAYTKAALVVTALALAVVADYRRGPSDTVLNHGFGVIVLNPCSIRTANGEAEVETGLCP